MNCKSNGIDLKKEKSDQRTKQLIIYNRSLEKYLKKYMKYSQIKQYLDDDIL